eukprot:13204150-Alexandrium_andersonii.AAC.1
MTAQQPMTSGPMHDSTMDRSRLSAGSHWPRISQVLTAALHTTASGSRRDLAMERSNLNAAWQWCATA